MRLQCLELLLLLGMLLSALLVALMWEEVSCQGGQHVIMGSRCGHLGLSRLLLLLLLLCCG